MQNTINGKTKIAHCSWRQNFVDKFYANIKFHASAYKISCKFEIS